MIDSHAAGEPFRLVVSGLPEIPIGTMAERRTYASEHLDGLRKALMWEPRGHADMYGGWPGAPIAPDSDLSVLFLHNEGFSTMCGHGIIAVTTILLEMGVFLTNGDKTTIRIDTPAGQIISTARFENNRVAGVEFQNVASFVTSLDNQVSVPGIGDVRYDLAFGGAFYAYVDAQAVGLEWPPGHQHELIPMGRAIKQAIVSTHEISHPLDPDLGFLYGVIFTGPPVDIANSYRNICIFADGEIDRSPTGTGVSGRLAIDAARGRVGPGESLTIESIIGTTFTVSFLARTEVGIHPAVVPQVSGTAHITGRSTLWIDPTDSNGEGFLIR